MRESQELLESKLANRLLRIKKARLVREFFFLSALYMQDDHWWDHFPARGEDRRKPEPPLSGVAFVNALLNLCYLPPPRFNTQREKHEQEERARLKSQGSTFSNRSSSAPGFNPRELSKLYGG